MPKISRWPIFVPLRFEIVRSEQKSGADRCLLCVCADLTLQFWSVTVRNTLKLKVIKELLVFYLFIYLFTRCRSEGLRVDGTTVLKWLWEEYNSTMGTRFVCSLKVFRWMVYSHVTSFGPYPPSRIKKFKTFWRLVLPTSGWTEQGANVLRRTYWKEPFSLPGFRQQVLIPQARYQPRTPTAVAKSSQFQQLIDGQSCKR